ncbi:MAG: arginine--tRNA ligase, partial [Wolbachia endosymbiont of Andrena agilissima]|nr:arginine--tRNA ligase [Wolbachia endosymbiont of Andrena agilissima]
MNIFKQISSLIFSKLNELKQRGVISTSAANFIIEPPSNRVHGDIYTNVAMVLAKHEKKNPIEIAEVLAKEFELFDEVAKVEIAGSGFINMH